MKIRNLSVLFIFLTVILAANDETSLLELAKKNHLQAIPKSKLELLQIIEDPTNSLTQEKIELGKILFFDPRLSKSNLISCNTCHNLGMGGVDGVSKAIGHEWQPNPLHLNSPTVYNAVFFSHQLWDGRVDDLKGQISGPIHANFEMASSAQEIEEKLQNIKGYKKLFQNAFGINAEISFDEVVKAIAAFESTLVTRSRFDDFMLGDENALTQNEKEGLKIFINKRCAKCHKGYALGGWKVFFRHDRYKYTNIGSFQGNQNKLIKVPTLRNITQTAPYFHNGMIWSLEETIYEMGKIQLNTKLKQIEVDRLLDFLKSLDGEKPKIIYPNLPF